ncbi:class I SAM-dependent DNA methyltransferase [Propioniciclava tarda]|uniref:Class I SAM-dependent methyltransferase n=1 Tax=Propioniciclava tarda TaxID=433330 RepID=A0A4Q9KMV3_PROTD|nr:class I SAM-dependent methyltransferase [Propioniciclava tarda]TBT95907.1 class I SAM-dependent methyltransferase [Propioniciclava tarda]SMO41329.1 Methyltransferase domain-containing protein [Propioniciclava tarda]
MHETFFDEAAATWDDDPAKVVRAREIADGIAAAIPLTGNEDALEFGCGTGLITFALGDRVGHVTLADSSPGMLAVVRDRIAALPDASRGRYEASLLDLTTDALAPASVDLIYASMSLHHVADVAAVLATFRTALRPGGHLAIADLDHDPDGQFHAHHDHFVGHHGFDRDALASELETAGFSRPTFTTVSTINKHTHEGTADFDVFLAVCSVV